LLISLSGGALYDFVGGLSPMAVGNIKTTLRFIQLAIFMAQTSTRRQMPWKPRLADARKKVDNYQNNS
jgi:hypothetical protein